MRSWLEGAISLAVAGCHADPAAAPACPPDSALTWTTFGEPFARSWCTGCHSSALGEADRQGAPVGVDFDRLAMVQSWSERIRVRAVEDRTMPPAGGPSADDLARLDEWLACGAPGEDPSDPTPGPDTALPPVACDRVGRWVLSGATCEGTDVTASWLAMFPTTELTVTEADGTCAIDYHLADPGCDERQLWRSDLEGPTSSFEFVGTVSCEPSGCAWASIPDDVCTVAAQPVTQQVAVTELSGGRLALGPLAPPDLVTFCTELGLVFEQVSR